MVSLAGPGVGLPFPVLQYQPNTPCVEALATKVFATPLSGVTVKLALGGVPRLAAPLSGVYPLSKVAVSADRMIPKEKLFRIWQRFKLINYSRGFVAVWYC